MKRYIEYIVIRIISIIAFLSPRKVALALGRLLGRLVYYFDCRHRSTTLDNLRLAFNKELTEAQRESIAKQVFSHFGEFVLELLRAPWLNKKKIEKIAEFQGLENLRRSYRKGKGVLIFTAHFGNWELMGIAQGYQGVPLNVLARALDNSHLEHMLLRIRGLSGNNIIYKTDAVRSTLQALKRGETVAILIDQNTRIEEGIFIDFFGRKACTTPILSSLALRSGASIIPAFSLPQGKGRYKFIYEKEISFQPSGDKEKDILHLTQICSSIIEGYVRRYPHYWFWMHRRWKNQPGNHKKEK
jgi:KDO2-lipid IV(A) lauroyltransferase